MRTPDWEDAPPAAAPPTTTSPPVPRDVGVGDRPTGDDGLEDAQALVDRGERGGA